MVITHCDINTFTHAKPDAIGLHPGPINCEIDVASAVADGPQAIIRKQITTGVAVHMAIPDLMLCSPKGSF